MTTRKSATPKRPRVRRCQLYSAGHVVHYLQARISYGRPHRDGQLVEAHDELITVDFGDEAKSYRNHEVERLVDRVGIGADVRVCEEYVILRHRIDHTGSLCLSISSADKPGCLAISRRCVRPGRRRWLNVSRVTADSAPRPSARIRRMPVEISDEEFQFLYDAFEQLT